MKLSEIFGWDGALHIAQLVSKFGVSDGHIHNILARRVWP
jgi:hypothetical protein